MRKLIVAEHISLDGIIQSPGAPDEDASGGFRLGGWIVPYAGEAVGRELQEIFNRVPKHVATHRSEGLGWHESRALEGDLAGAVRALKRQDGANLLTHGSADMVRQLLAAGLVDELRLMIYPVVLGRGKRLFEDGASPSALTLAHSSGTPGGVLLTRYAPGGEVRTGTFGGAE